MWQKNSNFCVGEIWQLYGEKRKFSSFSRILAIFRTKNETCQQKKKRQILSIPGDNQDWHVEPGSHFPPPPFVYSASCSALQFSITFVLAARQQQ